MDETLLARARDWMAADPDRVTVAELQSVIDRADARDLEERMAGPLAFGTAGMRGLLGAGESRMNRAVVLRAAAGVASHLRACVPDGSPMSAVIAHDARAMSRQFAEDTAAVLTRAGITIYLFPDASSTPLAAFAVTRLGASVGIVVTASHNPPAYNGYKVYWNNGAQIIPPHDKAIARQIAAAPSARTIPTMGEPEAREKGLWRDIPATLAGDYLSAIAALSHDPRGRERVRIVYTPLHGVGAREARAAFASFGFADVTVVAEQEAPDAEFPTTPFPNPEEPGALDLALALAAEKRATVVLANDPDADRLSVAMPERHGGYRQLTGNEVGALFGDYLLRATAAVGGRRLVMSTVVSSPMLKRMAGAFGVRYAEVLTGFKWIATTAMRLEREQNAHFVFGFEEALGYTIGTVVRDKDGVSAAAVFAEIVAVAASEGRTIEDELERLARAYGVYVSAQHNVVMHGAAGASNIKGIMSGLRHNIPKEIGGASVEAVRDMKRGTRSTKDGTTLLELPKSDVIAFDLEGEARVIARPSGTEPKIKYYFDLREPVADGEAYGVAHARAIARLAKLRTAFVQLAADNAVVR